MPIRCRSGSSGLTLSLALLGILLGALLLSLGVVFSPTRIGLPILLALLAVGAVWLPIRRAGRGSAPAISDEDIRVIALDSVVSHPAARDRDAGELAVRPEAAVCPESAVRPWPAGPDGVSVPTSARRELAERLYAIDWFQFEKLMAAAFRKKGYQVERRGGARADDGIDLILERNGERTAVQCKHWKTWKVNPKTVREFLGAMTGAGLRKGLLLALRGYTQDAGLKAREYGISLWSEQEILDLLRTTDAESDPELRALLDDTRKFCPRCESEMLIRTAKRGPATGSQFWGCSRYPICLYTLPLSGVEAPAETAAG